VSDTGASIVMIVGSDAHFIYLMRHYTRTSGYQAVVAPLDGEVVRLAQQKRPAMIVLESDLAEPASRDILQALKTNQATCDFPVMVCSWQEEEMSLLAQEADSYLQKPVLYEEFLAALKEVAHISGA
jgi:DNA-binding response OmpR family regulator